VKKFGLAALVCACAMGNAQGQVYDVTSDWSEISNPNGAWTYRQGDVPLPHVVSWQGAIGGWTSPQPGWARSENANTRLPFWFKSNGTETFANDFDPGDVVVHTTDAANGSGSGVASVAWTSPGYGTVKVEGAVWIGREIGRSMSWRLAQGCTQYASGMLAAGDAFSRANPATFASGATSASVLDAIVVRAGSVIALELPTTSGSGDFVGVRFKVTFTAKTQPCSADFNGDGFITFEDFDAFVSSFESGLATSDTNGDGCLDFTDFDDFVTALEAGC